MSNDPFNEPWGPTKELLLKKPSVAEQLEATWADLKGKEPTTFVPKMTLDQLRDFVRAYLAGHIFTSAQVREAKDVPSVFLPVLFGAFDDWTPEAKAEIGVLYANMSNALPRALNGNPMFTECRFMHKDDWKRASLAINTEIERLKHIPI